ncbi:MULTISPECIES: TetR/AcrR family transcriptional regulator [unclassified Microbacterium]|uniref:TetR/AcrR family transcriptional regulator n=1 Tax=unclassified Microbacterium TaxID=2609290 RepID=UPI000EA929F8|nr:MULTISPECIES: TetR/AcrR family transcriptional regulator [unclassified Microbacterium]MBT2483102.1 TetR family transcriptional regulator [Microbacterium sp. ISL-108]RKN66163.1 TetR/AcrR family transcriptional regulator [Microbacterium sp. CGR2]
MDVKRPVTLTQEVRRQRIIEAAIECLAREGWNGTKLALVAAEAGISRGLISYHFAGRDDLYEAVLDTVVETIFGEGSAAMQQRIDEASTARGKLVAYIEENLRFIGSHRREMAALGQVMPNLRGKDGAPRFDADAEEPVIAGTALLFEYGLSTGEFRGVDARLTAYTLRRCIDGAAVKIVADPGFDIDAYARELTALFLQGVQA